MLFKRSIRGGIALLLFSLIFHAGEGSAGNKSCQPVQYEIWGYYPYWLKDEWRKIDLELFDRVLFFDVPVTAVGLALQSRDWPRKWQGLIDAAKQSGTRLQPTFTLFDAKEFERIFSSPDQRKSLQADILALFYHAESSGLHLDFEIFTPISAKSSKGFRLFLKSLKHELGKRNRSLSLFVLAEDLAGLNDRESLKIPDHIVIQGYDAHWKEGGNAGPIVRVHGSMKVSWESSLKHYLSLGVPRHKILMSVPYYGYEWPTVSDAPGASARGVGSEISFATLPANLVPAVVASAMARTGQYGARRDPVTGSPYYVYSNETGWFQGWFEDAESLSAKFEFVKKEKLAGVAVFPLGYDNGDFEHLLYSHFRTPESCQAASISGDRHSHPAPRR